MRISKNNVLYRNVSPLAHHPMRFTGYFLRIIGIGLISQTLLATHEEGYYTGPLFANPGEIIPKHTLNIEPYFFYITNKNQSSDSHPSIRGGAVAHATSDVNSIFQPQAILGVTDWWSLQILPSFIHNVSDGIVHNDVGDTTVMPAIQLWRQDDSPYLPSVNLSIEETIPTGRYHRLSPRSNGADSTGLGSYQTNFGLNFQYVSHLLWGHESVTNLNLNYLVSNSVSIEGLNTYGGTIETAGTINPGNLIALDFAIEFSVTKKWVLVFETLLSRRQATRFSGELARSAALLADASIGNGVINQYTLAPAIEYNFSPNFGIMAGAWFTFTGNNTNQFYSPVIALNYITSG